MFGLFGDKSRRMNEFCKAQFGGEIYAVDVCLPNETWDTLDYFLSRYNEESKPVIGDIKIDPAIYGWVICSGLVSVRIKTREAGDYIKAFRTLMKDFDTFEQPSTDFILWPKTIGENKRVRKLNVLFGSQSAYNIIDSTTTEMANMSQRTKKEEFCGLYMLFGLWNVKVIFSHRRSAINTMKTLLDNIKSSGEL